MKKKMFRFLLNLQKNLVGIATSPLYVAENWEVAQNNPEDYKKNCLWKILIFLLANQQNIKVGKQ